MSTIAKAYIALGVVLLSIVMFFLGSASGSGGNYRFDIYPGVNTSSGVPIKYSFDLQHNDTIPAVVCDPGANRIVMVLNKIDQNQNATPVRGTTFCGNVLIQSGQLRQQI